MTSTLDQNVEDRVLELQNDGAAYPKYNPIFEAMVVRFEKQYKVAGHFFEHCINVLNGGHSTTFILSTEYRILERCVNSKDDIFVHKVIGGLLAGFYREWKYQNDKIDNVNKCAEIPEPPHHLDRAIAEQNAYYNKPTKQDTTMTIKIETKLFYNGVDIKGYSDDQLFGEIAKAEAEVERLEKIATKPKKLEAKIKELKEGIAQLAAAIDAR